MIRKSTHLEDDSVNPAGDQTRSGSSGRNGGKISVNVALKGLVIAVVAGLAAYLIYFGAVKGTAIMIIADHDINPEADTVSKTEYRVKDKVYFHVHRRFNTMDCNVATLAIDIAEGGSYKGYKKISYEVDKDFEALYSYIPGEYFRKPGKYQIRLVLDSKEFLKQEFEIK